MAAGGCAKKPPELLATGVYVYNLDRGNNPPIQASVDGAANVGIRGPNASYPAYATEHYFAANAGAHTLRIYTASLDKPFFECTFELPTASVADFEYGNASSSPYEPMLRCPPGFRPAPPAD